MLNSSKSFSQAPKCNYWDLPNCSGKGIPKQSCHYREGSIPSSCEVPLQMLGHKEQVLKIKSYQADSYGEYITRVLEALTVQ